MSEEEIRLIKGYFNDEYCCDLDELKEIANKMIDQLQQKENIIKETIEYVKKHTYKWYDLNGEEYEEPTMFEKNVNPKVILEILDKVD